MAVSATVAVAGAGFAGLSAAWELSRGGATVVVLDAARRPGGVVVTERPGGKEGFVVEGGPDGFLAAEPDIQELAREIGSGGRLVDQLASGSSLWTGRRLEPLAEGQAAALLGIQLPSGVGAQHAAPLQCGFRSFATGMADLVEALVARVGPPIGSIRPAQGVTGLGPAARGWRLSLSGGSTLEAEAVILALPAWIAARLVAAAGVPAARHLDEVIYYPTTTVSLAYREDQLAAPLAGTGFVSAPELAESGAALRACSYSWLKYPGRAPPGHALLRAFVGPVDGDPAGAAHGELARILGISGSPLWSRAFHWPRGLPRYKPGHAAHVAAVRERLARLPPLAIAGAGFDGAGVSACVKSGRAAARGILERLGR
jgi:oxygen-dependent protoporphyrinogen oxidase